MCLGRHRGRTIKGTWIVGTGRMTRLYKNTGTSVMFPFPHPHEENHRRNCRIEEGSSHGILLGLVRQLSAGRTVVLVSPTRFWRGNVFLAFQHST